MKRSTRIAYGGIISALSLVAMFFTGVFPFAEYALPAVSGVFLVVLVIEFGFKAALIAFAAVALLSIVITPNKEAVVLFIAFLGYYPIVKGKIETLRTKAVPWAKPVQWVLKFALFNAAAIVSYAFMIYVLGMTEIMEDFAVFKLGIWILLLLGNAVFLIYDIAATRLVSLYIYQIKPKYLRRLH